MDAVMKAYKEVGIRVVFALQYADRKGIETIPFWKDTFPSELHPHIYESRGMALQARLSLPEYSGLLIRRLAAEGVLDQRLNFAHSVWLSRCCRPPPSRNANLI